MAEKKRARKAVLRTRAMKFLMKKWNDTSISKSCRVSFEPKHATTASLVMTHEFSNLVDTH